MNGAKPAALSGALLARKGSAIPADVTARFLNLPLPPRISNASNGQAAKPVREPSPAVSPAAMAPAVAAASAPPCLGFAAAHERANLPRLDNTGRIKLTLRLDPCRHRKLKLLAAQLGDSVQEILCAALDGYMRQVAADLFGKRCVCLAGPERAADEVGAVEEEDSQQRASEIVERM